MSHQPDRPSGTRASRGPVSRDAGLLRIRALTKGVAVTSALGAVAIGVVLAQPAQSQGVSSPAATAPGQGAGSSAAQAVPVPPPAEGNQQQPLAAPPQPPAAAAPQAPPPAAVSGGS